MKIENETTAPWAESELVRVNGYPLCYERIRSGELEVRMPGGWKSSISCLKRLGFSVESPKKIRG